MKKIALLTMFSLLATFSFAQTVTVDASNPSPNNTTVFNSIQMAIHSFQASGTTTAASPGGVGVNQGNPAPDIINVLATSVVDEYIVIDSNGNPGNDDFIVLNEPLTIQGSGGAAIIALRQYTGASNQGTGANGFQDCGFCWRQDVNLTLKDLIFIPSKTNTPTDDAMNFRATANATNPIITMENIVLTANNGSNGPVTITGLDTPNMTGATGFGDDGIVFLSRTEGGSMTLNATNLIISSFSTNAVGTANDGLLAWMSGTTQDFVNCFVNLGPGCIISNINRFGIQNPYGGYINIQGSKEKPVIINNCGSDGIWNYSDTVAPTQPTICEVNYCIVNNCGNSGIKEQETAGRGFIKSIKNTIIANCKAPGIALFAFGTRPTGVTDTVEIDNVTMHNCGYSSTWSYGIAAPVYTSGGTEYKTNRNANITNTIVSGAGLTGIFNSSTGTFSVDYSALVTESMAGYEYALANATGGSGTINVGANVINSNPRYVTYAIGDFASSSFMDVTNSAFAGKGTGGSDLAGGADYVGGWPPPPTPTPLAVNNTWSIYK